jgi:hypothetical protein
MTGAQRSAVALARGSCLVCGTLALLVTTDLEVLAALQQQQKQADIRTQVYV